jgi:hypothetical protein
VRAPAWLPSRRIQRIQEIRLSFLTMLIAFPAEPMLAISETRNL